MNVIDTEGAPNRREFLRAAAGLSLAVVAGGRIQAMAADAPAAALRQVGAWVQIAPDETVWITLASAEMGQGVTTALPLIVAEELDADWSRVRVRVETHDAKTFGNRRIFGQLYTAGSTAVDAYFDILRRAGATARRILLHTAAARWGVDVAELGTEPGVVVHRASGRRMTFGEVVRGDLVTQVPPVTDADLKAPGSYRLIGRDVPRLEVPAKVRGGETYSIDVRVPGMVHAAVLRAPVEGEAAASIDAAAARAIPGVIAVLKVPEGVAVVAQQWETALAARAALKVEWTRNSPFRTADSAADLARVADAAADLARRGVAGRSGGTRWTLSPPTGPAWSRRPTPPTMSTMRSWSPSRRWRPSMPTARAPKSGSARKARA